MPAMSKTLPYSQSAEYALIAALISAPTENIPQAIEAGVTAGTFYATDAAAAYSAILACHAENFEIAVWSVHERSKVGLPVLVDMTTNPPLIIGGILKELRSLEMRRAVIRQATALTETAAYGTDGIAEGLMRLLATQSEATRSPTWTQLIDAASTRAQAAIAGANPDERSLTTGFAGLDRLFQPFRRKELVVLAARPSVGKSSKMRHIAQRNAEAGAHVMITSLEVGCDDVVDQMAAASAAVALRSLSTAHPVEKRDFLAALAKMRALPLHCYENDRSVAAIVARARALHASNPIDLVCIDHLGLISDCEPAKGETKASAVGRVTRAFKRLAMDLDCVVLLLAQLNRSSVIEDNREPRLSDLRDSGDVEQDADRVVFIHRPDENPLTNTSQTTLSDADELPRFYTQVIQAKGRNVGTGQTALFFNRRLARFESETRASQH
jgi:replicative DNA helicase